MYGVGDEPDPRFSFANERTFLAWIRTSLGLLAGGAAIDALDLPMRDILQTVLTAILLLLGLLCAPAAWIRWERAERAIRTASPLSSMGSAMSFVIGTWCSGYC